MGAQNTEVAALQAALAQQQFSGGPLSEEEAKATYARPLRNTIALLGDSITNQNSSESSAVNYWYGAQGYFTWANILLGQRFSIVTPGGATHGEFGASGKTTQQLITEGHVAAAAASSADWCVVHAGTNDSPTVPAATIAANLLTIWRTLTSAGKRVVATTILPRNNQPGDTAAIWATIRDANRLIRSNARNEPGVVLCDWYSRLVDPVNGNAAAAYFADGVHPNATGARLMGQTLADTLAPISIPSPGFLPWDSVDANSLLPNPFMSGNAGGLATSLTSYVIGAGAATYSKVARTDGIPGEWQQITVTASATSADGVQIQSQNTAAGVDWNVGDTVYAVCEFETDPASWAVRFFNFSLDCWNGTGAAATLRLASSERNALTQALLRPERGILHTPRFVVPAGTARLQANFYVYGLGTIRVGRMDIVKA